MVLAIEAAVGNFATMLIEPVFVCGWGAETLHNVQRKQQMDAYPAFAQLLNQYLQAQERTPTWLAKRLGVNPSTVNRWLNFDSRPGTPDTVARIADILGIHSPPDRQKLLIAAGYGYSEVIVNQPPAQLVHSPVPLQRPPRPEHFVEREAELNQLLTNLQPGQVITLCGPGGIGKSTLAAQAVWQLAPADQAPVRFPDGIVFYSFYNQGAVDLALQHIALSFGEDLQPTPTLAAQRALAGKHALLILDGAEQADDLTTVLAIRDRCGVLVTSRRHSDAVTTWHDLSPLTPNGAVTLLRAWGRQRASEDALVICELLGYLPLAIRLVGRYLAEREETASAYLAWLKATPLTALDQGQRQWNSVPLLLEQSVGQVSQTAQQVLGVVGLLALAPFEPETITAALPQVADDQRLRREKQSASAMPASRRVQQGLGELVNYGLLRRRDHLYEVTHALAHTYARERLSPPDGTLAHLATYYAAFSYSQKKQDAEGFATLALACPHLVALVHRGLERGTWTAVITLAEAIDGYLDLQGKWLDRLTVLQAGLAAAKMLQERQEEGIYLGRLGSTFEALGQYQVAIEYYEQALVISRERGDRSHESEWLGSLGGVYAALGQYQRAIEYNEQALAITREIGDRRGEAIRLGYLGTFFANLGQYLRAIEYREQALAIAREIGDRRGESIHLGNLGRMYLEFGRYQEAIEYIEQALVIAREIGDRRREGVRLGHLGKAYSVLGQYPRAIGYYGQALAMAREMGDRRREGIWLGRLGDVYTEIGQGQMAIEYSEQALLIAREIGDRREEGGRLSHLGSVYHILGQNEQAILFMEQGLQIAREIGDTHNEALRLCDLGIVYSDLAQMDRARHYWIQSLRIFEQLKSPYAEIIRGRLAAFQPEE